MSTSTSKPLKPKRGTTAQNNAYTGEAYEVTLDTDKKTLVVHDGLTAGGFPLARADEVVSTVNGLTPDANGNVDVGGMPLGTVFPYTGRDVPAGTLRADGTTYTNMQSAFPEFYEWVVASGLTVPLADYALVEGSCGYYGLDTSTGTVRMPTLAAGVFGTVEAGKYGQAVRAGLPNITGEVGTRGVMINDNTFLAGNGAFVIDNTVSSDLVASFAVSQYRATQGLSFSANNDNPIYGRSDTVTPSHVKYPWVIVVYNAAVPPSVAQAGEFVSLLSDKAGKDLENLSADGKAFAAGASMPSNRYVDLTLGASGSSYTAPANGWITLAKSSNAPTQYIYMASDSIAVQIWSSIAGETIQVYIPVCSGQTFTVAYTVGGSTAFFKFNYAQGAN